MTYIFTGIFSDDELSHHAPDDSKLMVFRAFSIGTIKMGVLFPVQASNQIEEPDEETHRLLRLVSNYGINQGTWCYYMCWGGVLETVALAHFSEAKIDTSTYIRLDDLNFSELSHHFGSFGIPMEESGHFEPFKRGYWGEFGY